MRKQKTDSPYYNTTADRVIRERVSHIAVARLSDMAKDLTQDNIDLYIKLSEYLLDMADRMTGVPARDDSKCKEEEPNNWMGNIPKRTVRIPVPKKRGEY